VPEGEAEARTVLIVLGAFYPQAKRARVTRTVLDVMEEGFRHSRMEMPAWLATLRAELGEDED
jgi:hypothetical protein